MIDLDTIKAVVALWRAEYVSRHIGHEPLDTIDALVAEVERLQAQYATLKSESDARRKLGREMWARMKRMCEGDPETGQCRPGRGD